MKKIKLIITLLVVVTGLCSLGYSVFDGKPEKESFKFYVDYRNTIEKNNTIGCFIVDKKEISSVCFKQEKSKGLDTLNGVLVTFSGFISSQEVLTWMQENKTRPATIKELQSYGMEYPMIKDYGVVALGSDAISATLKSVPWISFKESGAKIQLYPFEGKWVSFYKFLAVRI